MHSSSYLLPHGVPPLDVGLLDFHQPPLGVFEGTSHALDVLKPLGGTGRTENIEMEE